MTLLIQDSSYLALLAMECLKIRSSDLRYECLDSHTHTNFGTIFSGGSDLKNNISINESHQYEPTLSPPLNLMLLALGPSFVNPNGDFPLLQTIAPQYLHNLSHSLSNEVLERENTLEAIRESNREMEALLAQLRIPRTDVLTLKRVVNLVFEGATQELVFVLFPKDISRLELSLGLPNPMIGDSYKEKISLLFRKRKCLDQPSPSSPSGKGKNIPLKNP